MSVASAETSGRPLVGIALVVVATLCFAIGDTITKYLAALYPVPVIMAVRYAVNLVLLVAIFWPGMRSRLWAADRFWLVIARGLCLAAASASMGLALRLMPLGETTAIIYLAPFAVMVLAAPLLGEKVSAIGWAGAVFGFVGVLLIARPGGDLDPVGVIFALGNAALATAYHLLTRLLSKTETTVSMLFHTAWVGAAIFLVFALPDLPAFAPPPLDIGLMLVLGTMTTIAHYLFTAAYREAPASLLAPVNYVHLAWAGALGWLVFAHIPDALSITGMVMVAVAGAAVALSAHLERRRGRKVALQPAEPMAE